MSASLWGCELKFLIPSVDYQMKNVSLLVRLWVEIYSVTGYNDFDQSASLWGCELKYSINDFTLLEKRSASLWGCELKYEWLGIRSEGQMSASLWGCELKYFRGRETECRRNVSLLVRLWVEICENGGWLVMAKSASLWGCELK